jgi:sec-independent protein translocase protein TatC
MVEKTSLIEHLAELRKRVLIIVIFFMIFSVAGFYLSSEIIAFINADLFPGSRGVQLIATQPVDFLYTKINVGLFLGLILSMPVILWQVFAFARPALSPDEKRILKLAMLGGFVLFIAGLAFSYLVIMRFTIWFLADLAYSADVANLWNINQFMSFIFMFSIIMALVFQLPVITTTILRLGVVKLEDLKSKRAYVIAGAFIVAAVITPTIDPFTQCIVALPMLVLFEGSLLVGRFLS